MLLENRERAGEELYDRERIEKGERQPEQRADDMKMGSTKGRNDFKSCTCETSV